MTKTITRPDINISQKRGPWLTVGSDSTMRTVKGTPEGGHGLSKHRGWNKHAKRGHCGRGQGRGQCRRDDENEAGVGGRGKTGGQGRPLYSLDIPPLLWLTSFEPRPWMGLRCSFWKGWNSSAGGHSPSGAAGKAQELGVTGHGSSERGAGGQPPEVCGRPWVRARWS